jgi:hypothetical protein
MSVMFLAGMTLGCSHTLDNPDHGHDPGSQGGFVVSVGHDHYHIEALFTGGEIRFYTLGQDQTQVITVPVQDLVAYVRTPQTVEAVAVPLTASRQPADPPGQTSVFTGRMPAELTGSQVIVTVPSIQIQEKRYRFSFQTEVARHGPVMPTKVTEDAERQLYMTASGKYSQSDIVANGSQPASQKYRGFQSNHDFKPQPGDRLCPITHTKADPKCTWIVDGMVYAFCCPPCIDEFVKRAKSQPTSIHAPDSYVQK